MLRSKGSRLSIGFLVQLSLDTALMPERDQLIRR
jgi:hypothetical protein